MNDQSLGVLGHPAAGFQRLTREDRGGAGGGEHLCLSDYFASVDSNQVDTVALQVVTVGAGATEQFDTIQADHNYSEAYFFHGLAVQTAEASAEYLHRHIRRELGLAENQGKRYSWGYPACPDLEDN